MPIQIFIPALAPIITEGKLVKWLKKQEDVAKAHQVLKRLKNA